MSEGSVQAVSSTDPSPTDGPNPSEVPPPPPTNIQVQAWNDALAEPDPGDSSQSSTNAPIPDGAVWNSKNETELASIGALPKVDTAIQANSVADAARLASGTSVQTLISEGESTDSINGAYELLGISNRQISLYAEAAAKGGVGKDQQIFGTLKWTPEGSTAFNALKDAARMRAAVSETGLDDIKDKGLVSDYAGTLDSGAPLTHLVPKNRMDGLDFTGMTDAVNQGVKNANVYYFPGTVANGMLYGSGGINPAITSNQSAFGSSPAAALTAGQASLKTATSDAFVLHEALPFAADTIRSLSNAAGGGAAYTPQQISQLAGAADLLMQGIGPAAFDRLKVLAAQNPGYLSADDMAGLQRQAVDDTLKANNITGVDAQGIGDALLEAYASPEFAHATGGDQASANSMLNTMAFFDPKAMQTAALLETATGTPTTPQGSARQRMLQGTLKGTSNNGDFVLRWAA